METVVSYESFKAGKQESAPVSGKVTRESVDLAFVLWVADSLLSKNVTSQSFSGDTSDIKVPLLPKPEAR